jgi:hypothetical protein
MKQPFITVVILNWNGKKWLEKCLGTLFKTSYTNKEVIVVNNGSTDSSKDYLKKKYPQVRVIELKVNVGYAKANTIGVEQAKGKYVLFLNNDTEVTPGFIEPLVAIMEEQKDVGAVQPQMRSMINRDLLDAAGMFFTKTGFLYYYGYAKKHNLKIYQQQFETFSIKGACFIMETKEYLRLGGFDEDFVCYVEETDLCHRIWLSGKRILYEPKSVMYHYGGGDMHVMTKDELTTFRAFRNRMYSFLKNFSFIELLRLVPLHIAICEIFIFYTLLSGKWKKALYAQVGVFAWIYNLPEILVKRRHIQKDIRKISDKELLKKITREPRLSYYFYIPLDLSKYQDE